MQRNKIKWRTQEYVNREKSANWFWALGIIAVFASFISVILGNFLLGLLILMSSFILGKKGTGTIF